MEKKQFMLLFRGGDEKFMSFTQDEQNAHMQLWTDWETKTGGHGNQLLPEAKYLDSQQVITDGPFTEGKEVIGGYIMLEASDLDEAAKIAKGCPIFELGGTTEVRQIM